MHENPEIKILLERFFGCQNFKLVNYKVSKILDSS